MLSLKIVFFLAGAMLIAVHATPPKPVKSFPSDVGTARKAPPSQPLKSDKEKGLQALQVELQKHADLMRDAEERLNDLRKEIGQAEKLDRYDDLKRDLETQKRIHDSIYIRILQEKVDSQAAR